jgi:hypothetical protein
MSKLTLGFLILLVAAQDDKKAPADPKPKIAMALPLAISPGAAVKVTLRGLNLDQASDVKLRESVEGATVAIKSKGKADLPKETDPAVYGDTKVEIEITLPAGYSPDKVGLVAVNGAGQTTPYDLKVIAKDKLIPEKEPNGGFATAQAVEAGQTIQGSIAQAMDVDVYKVTGKKGETWIFEVEAQKRGSVADPLITMHDAKGHIVATADDTDASRDPMLRVLLPADGVYTVTLIDAHNAGGGTHPYLLHVRREN